MRFLEVDFFNKVVNKEIIVSNMEEVGGGWSLMLGDNVRLLLKGFDGDGSFTNYNGRSIRVLNLSNYDVWDSNYTLEIGYQVSLPEKIRPVKKMVRLLPGYSSPGDSFVFYEEAGEMSFGSRLLSLCGARV